MIFARGHSTVSSSPRPTCTRAGLLAVASVLALGGAVCRPAEANGPAMAPVEGPRLLLAQAQPAAAAVTARGLRIEEAWVRATVPEQRASGAFFTLSSERPLKLIAVESPVAEIVELHEMALVDNVMRMRAVDAIALEAGKKVALQPGGLHVMLIDLRQQMKVDDKVPLTLVFENEAGQREVQLITATVRPLTAASGRGDAGGHSDKSSGMHSGSSVR